PAISRPKIEAAALASPWRHGAQLRMIGAVQAVVSPMKRRGKAGKAADLWGPKAAGRKRIAIAKPKSQPRPAAAGLDEQHDRNRRELNEALQQQAATAEVLRLISA